MSLVFKHTTKPKYMVEHPSEPGHFVYILGNAIMVTWSDTDPLAGSVGVPGYADEPGRRALFSYPQGLFYIGNDVFLVFDTGNHCLRKLSKTYIYIPSDFAGICRVSGKNDGGPNYGKLHRPRDGLLDLKQPHQLIYLTDYRENSLRSVDLRSGYIRTIVKSIAMGAGVLFWDNTKNNTIVIAQKRNIFSSIHLEDLSKFEYQVEYAVNVTAVVSIAADVYIVSDSSNLFILEFGKEKLGFLKALRQSRITALLLKEGKLYVGSDGPMVSFPGKSDIEVVIVRLCSRSRLSVPECPHFMTFEL